MVHFIKIGSVMHSKIFYVALSDPDSMKFQQWLGPFHMDWRTTRHANGLLTFFQECLHIYYSLKIVRKPLACMVILQSMWTGPWEAVSKWVTERVLHEDKNHNTGLAMIDPPIMVQNKQ